MRRWGSYWLTYSLASSAKNTITLNSIPLLVVPFCIFLSFGYKMNGLIDTLSNLSGIKRSYLFMNAAIISMQTGTQLLQATDWSIKESGTIRFGMNSYYDHSSLFPPTLPRGF